MTSVIRGSRYVEFMYGSYYVCDNYIYFQNDTQIQPYSGNERYAFKFHDFMFEINGMTHEDEGRYSCSAFNVSNNITGHLRFSLTVLGMFKIM